MSLETYGEMMDKLVDRMAKYDERADIFRRNDIPKGHFYNVINPNRQTTAGNPFYTPVEWLVKLTRDAQDYCMLKKVNKDCGCICITPDDVKELQNTDPAEALIVIQKVLGMVKK
jgi:hypothetical protein